MQPLLAHLPLFPLDTVLFPDGLLPLRVFEARYMDMTRECLREKTPFGVCLLKSGSEVLAAPPAATEARDKPQIETTGCLAEIVSCDSQQLGVLLLRCRGTRRFRLMSSHVEKDGLLRGVAEAIEPDADDEDEDAPGSVGQRNQASEQRMQLASCSEVLARIIEQAQQRDAEQIPFLEPYRLDDATWVGNRLAEILPISMRARQQLMALDDAHTRVELVHQFMVKHQLL